MDDFVRSKLTEWGFSELIKDFEEQGIDQESLYCLDDDDVANLIPKVGTRSKFKKRLKLLKEAQIPTNQEPTELSGQNHEDESDSAQVEPSTSETSFVGKRKSDFQGESSEELPPNKKRYETAGGSYTDHVILSDVKRIMAFVNDRLPKDDNKFIQFLKTEIRDLETDKRELVGVFGKTGAGKSSLINAVIGEKKLLPSGDVSACTSVMIKVEANRRDDKYEAEIEFITKEEWKDELWSLLNFLGDSTEQNDDLDGDEKLTALYGDEWKDKSLEMLMELKYFKEIPEFLISQKKFLRCETARELSAKFVKYTKTGSKDGDSKGVKKWYWPLVKCVIIRVPDNDLLQHVTLVDLPGNGDRNKSRDKMWKEVVGNCSTVWIVTDINRAASEPEPWEILESASSIMGNGGECQNIHFICTKTDHIDSDCSLAEKRTLIFDRNMRAKKEVTHEFNKLHKVKKHFGKDCFRVFTVSSREFEKKKLLTPDETEIPKLQEFLQGLNDWHSETLNYVSGAQGILSLIQGARFKKEGGGLTDVYRNLVKNLMHDTDKVRQEMVAVCGSFEKCLSEGVEKSKGSYEKILHSFLYPARMKGSAFHKVLKSVVANHGTHKPKKGKPKNLNDELASRLTDCIDEEFKKTFPNERGCGAFNGVIDSFSLGTEKLIHKYKEAELLLAFLKTEEDKIKTRLDKIIRHRKKIIYSSLTTTVEETMYDCYERAAQIRGENSLKNMRSIIEKHVCDSKDVMFEKAKDEMLNLLRELMKDILKLLKETLLMSIELTINTDGSSIPDLNVEFDMVKNYYNELMGIQATDQHAV